MDFSRKIWKKPLALFLSSGIFLPVAGDEPDDDKQDSNLKRVEFEKPVGGESRNENKKFRKKLLTKTKTVIR